VVRQQEVSAYTRQAVITFEGQMSYEPRILLVDDEPALRRVFEAVLSQDGYSVAVAATGRHAMLQLREVLFDLIVVDLSLPDVDGLQLIHQIQLEFPTTKVLALSGYMAPLLQGLALAAGAQAAIAKPLLAHELRYAVYRILDPSCSWRPPR